MCTPGNKGNVLKKKRGQTIHTVHLTKCTDHLLCSALVLCMLYAGRTSNHLHGANSSHLLINYFLLISSLSFSPLNCHHINYLCFLPDWNCKLEHHYGKKGVSELIPEESRSLT